MAVLALRPPAAWLAHILPWPGAMPAAVLAVAAAVAMLVSRVVRRTSGRLLGCGLGCLAGTVFLVGIAVPPHRPADDLPALIALALAGAWLVTRPGLVRLRWPVLAGFAIAAAWWLADRPVGMAGFSAAAPRAALTAGWLVFLSLRLAEADAWTITAAAFALFAALHAVGAAPIWPLLAIIPSASCAVAPARPPPMPLPAATPRRKRSSTGRSRSGRTRRGAVRPIPAPPSVAPPARLLPASLSLAVFAAAAADQGHRLPGPIDATCLAPVAAAWLMGRFAPRLRRFGPAGGPLKALAAVALVALIAFSAAALAGLR